MGTAAPQSAFVDKADVFEHRARTFVVGRHVDPSAVKAEVVENVFEHGESGGGSVAHVPLGFVADEYGNLSIAKGFVDGELSFADVLTFFGVDGKDVAVGFVVRIMEYLVPLLLSGIEHLLGFVSEVGGVAVGVASEPAVGDFIIFEPVSDSSDVISDDWAKFTSGWHIERPPWLKISP